MALINGAGGKVGARDTTHIEGEPTAVVTHIVCNTTDLKMRLFREREQSSVSHKYKIVAKINDIMPVSVVSCVCNSVHMPRSILLWCSFAGFMACWRMPETVGRVTRFRCKCGVSCVGHRCLSLIVLSLLPFTSLILMLDPALCSAGKSSLSLLESLSSWVIGHCSCVLPSCGKTVAQETTRLGRKQMMSWLPFGDILIVKENSLQVNEKFQIRLHSLELVAAEKHWSAISEHTTLNRVRRFENTHTHASRSG